MTDSLPLVKDDSWYLSRSSAEIKQFAEGFFGPGSDNTARLTEAVDGIYGEKKTVVKKRLEKRGDKGGWRPPYHSKPRIYCYHVEPATQEACSANFTEKGSLKHHFTLHHPTATWDGTLPVWKVGQESDADNQAVVEAPREAPGQSTSGLMLHSKVTPTDYLDDYAGEFDETPEDTAASYRQAAAHTKAKPKGKRV